MTANDYLKSIQENLDGARQNMEDLFSQKQIDDCLQATEECDDCISRQEVINAFYIQSDDDGWWTGTTQDVEELLNGLKSTQLKPKWTPVSERLPEDEQEILFSTKTGRVHSGKYHDDNSANQWYSHRDKSRAWNNVVNAWMPLPKPYEPQESEEVYAESNN